VAITTFWRLYRSATIPPTGASRKIGLWSALGQGYYKHFEMIQNTFGYQCLNDHNHDGEHLALLPGIPSVYSGDEQAFTGVKTESFFGDDAIRPQFPGLAPRVRTGAHVDACAGEGRSVLPERRHAHPAF